LWYRCQYAGWGKDAARCQEGLARQSQLVWFDLRIVISAGWGGWNGCFNATLIANAIVVLRPITSPRGLEILVFTPTSTMQCLLVFCSDIWSPRIKRKPSQCIRLCSTRTNAVCSPNMHEGMINVRCGRITRFCLVWEDTRPVWFPFNPLSSQVLSKPGI
jgi:hypothetical protein